MIALCIPTFNRLEFTKICVESLFKHTDRNLASKIVVYDNNSWDKTVRYIRGKLPYRVGDYPSAWIGFNLLWKEVRFDSAIEFIGKVDNDIEFTRQWLSEIIDCFEKDKTIGSIRYGMSGSSGLVGKVSEGGYHGGLKIFRKEVVKPVTSVERWCGSTTISDNIKSMGMTCMAKEVGVIDLNYKYPDLADKYTAEGWSRARR